jgi:hypothetical protein
LKTEITIDIGDKVRTYSNGKHHKGIVHSIKNNDVATVYLEDNKEQDVMYCRLVDLIKIN